MGIISEKVKVKIGTRNFKYYKELGYNFEHVGDEIEVNIKHLKKRSTAEVLIECDYCKKNIMRVPYVRYTTIVEKTGGYSCNDCHAIKTRQTVKQKYNVDNVAQLESVKNKKRETCLKLYNVEYPILNDDIKKSVRTSMIDRYGVEYASQSEEIKSKIAKSSYQNGTVPTSKQQRYLFSLYNSTYDGCFLNYPISRFNSDICFPDEKLDIELDCGGHNLAVKMGYETTEEFNRKEIIRNSVIKREGYKQMRIISTKDFLPSDEILLQLLSHSKKYFSETSHTWISWDIDNSKMINAENKDTDGVFFDYGKLRKIKKSA